MVIVIRSFQSVYADIRSHRSVLFLSNWIPRISTSINPLLQAYWSRGWYVRRRPCNKIHHWSRFCCDSFVPWIVLRSFRHWIRAHCETEVANVEQAQQMIPLITSETSFGLNVSKLFFGVDVLGLDFWVQVRKTETIRSHNSRAGSPSNLNPASKEMISDSVELCETEVCFLHIQFIGTNVWLPKKHTMFLKKWILNPQDLPQNQSLETILVCIVLQCYPHNNIVCIHSCDENMKSIDSDVCHKLWSILRWIVQVYSLTIEYQVFQFLPKRNISEQFESMWFDNSPTDFISSSLKWWSSMHGVNTL